MKIAGIISRVVEKNERSGELVDRVFMIPDDLTVFRQLDGAKRRGANEIAVTVAGVGGFKVGEPCEVDSDTDAIRATSAPAATPATPSDAA